MFLQEEERKETSPWDKWWVFALALLCVISTAGLGTWGRIRMLEDDTTTLDKKLEAEEKAHNYIVRKLNKRLLTKNKAFLHLEKEMAMAKKEMMRSLSVDVKSFRTVKPHAAQDSEAQASARLSSECNGVHVPSGFEYAPQDMTIFPHDLLDDGTALHELLRSRIELAPLTSLTSCLQKHGLFTQPTYPWAQWTWLQALLDRPKLAGNFTEWGVGGGGSSMFLGRLARLRGDYFAGFDAWGASGKAHEKQLAQGEKQCGLSVPVEARFYDLSHPSNSWPQQEQLAFSHIDSDDYNTTLGVLKVVYDSTVDGGIFAVDNFFHASGGTKRAVEHFFKTQTPGKSPLIFPVFPGLSVLIFKGRFANATKGDQQNGLDGNFYSFEFIKGQPAVIDSVNRSALQLFEVHQAAKQDPSVNKTSMCWLSHALQNAQSLQEFVSSPKQSGKEWAAADIFRFLSGSVPLTQNVGVA